MINVNSTEKDKDLSHFLHSKNRTAPFQALQELYYLHYLSNTQRRKTTVLTIIRSSVPNL